MLSDRDLVRVDVGGADILVEVVPRPGAEGEEVLVSATDGVARLETALRGISATASDVLRSAEQLPWSKLTVELGVEFAAESGTLLAIVGKVGATSALKVTLEFDRAAGG